MPGDPFVPDGFEPPRALALAELHLVPLGPEHNESDHAAWTSSIAHIRATPGFEAHSSPPADGLPLVENLDDLERHARDFEEHTGFTYTVLTPGTEEVIGCVYIYPAKGDEHDAQVRSWVRADRRSSIPCCTARCRAGSRSTGRSSGRCMRRGPADPRARRQPAAPTAEVGTWRPLPDQRVATPSAAPSRRAPLEPATATRRRNRVAETDLRSHSPSSGTAARRA